MFVVAAIIIAGGSFYGGMLYGKSTVSAANPGQFRNGAGFAGTGTGGTGQGGFRRGGGPGGMGGFTTGEILSKDATSITLKLRNGGSQIIFFSDKTTIGKMTDGTADDLVVGKEAVVMGSANSDGSLNAQSIQIRPVPPMDNATTTPAK